MNKEETLKLSVDEAKNRIVYEVLPKMADYYDEIKNLTLEEARQRLRNQIGEDWVERTVDLIGSDRLKEIRPSWYLTFVEGEDGDIGRDKMSDSINRYVSREHAIMEIAYYLAMNETHMYEYYLNVPLDFDALNLTVRTGEPGHDYHVHLVDSLPQDVSTQEFFQLLGKQREMMIRIGVAVRDHLRNS